MEGREQRRTLDAGLRSPRLVWQGQRLTNGKIALSPHGRAAVNMIIFQTGLKRMLLHRVSCKDSLGNFRQLFFLSFCRVKEDNKAPKLRGIRVGPPQHTLPATSTP